MATETVGTRSVVRASVRSPARNETPLAGCTILSPERADAVRDSLRTAPPRRRARSRGREFSLVVEEVIPTTIRSRPSTPTGMERTRKLAAHQYFDDRWTFWIDMWERKRELEGGGVSHTMQELGTVYSIQEFWQYFNNITLGGLQPGCSLHLFKGGIRPQWEDPANRSGGRFRVSKAAGGPPIDGRLWLDLCLALVGEQFEPSDAVCGGSFAAKHGETHLSVWVRRESGEVKAAIQELVGNAAVVWISHNDRPQQPVLHDKIALKHRRARSTPMQVSDEFIQAEIEARFRLKSASISLLSVAAVVASTLSSFRIHRRAATRPQNLSFAVLPETPKAPPPTPAAPSTPYEMAAQVDIPTSAAACAAMSETERRALRAQQLRAAADERYEEAIVIRDLLKAAANLPPADAAADVGAEVVAGVSPGSEVAVTTEVEVEARGQAPGWAQPLVHPITGMPMSTAAQRKGVPGHRRRHTDTAKGDFIPTRPLPRHRPAHSPVQPLQPLPPSPPRSPTRHVTYSLPPGPVAGGEGEGASRRLFSSHSHQPQVRTDLYSNQHYQPDVRVPPPPHEVPPQGECAPSLPPSLQPPVSLSSSQLGHASAPTPGFHAQLDPPTAAEMQGLAPEFPPEFHGLPADLLGLHEAEQELMWGERQRRGQWPWASNCEKQSRMRMYTVGSSPPFVHSGRLYPSGLTRKMRRAIQFDHPDRARLGCPEGTELGFEVPNGPVSAQEYTNLVGRSITATQAPSIRA
eukprot:Hpha_TRINITY_DN16303_c2_g1::TRINITY_DN16303_c2_g1_i1::g.61738::m.61738